MFNLFKKNSDSIWGILSVKNAGNVTSDFSLLSTEWEKVDQLLKDMDSGKIINLNFQASGADAMNLYRNDTGNLVLMFAPKAFLNGEEVPYYQKENISIDTARKEIEYFFINKKRNEELNWDIQE